MESRVHALKVRNDDGKVYESLCQGVGRFGWSYVESANIHALRARIEAKGWSDLSNHERKCYQAFLLDLRPGDWVVYINTPTWGHCTAAQVTRPYYWEWEDHDFNHRFGVDPDSKLEFDRNDALVHPALSARLKLQGRHWKISTTREFMALVEALRQGRGGTKATGDDNLRHLAKEVRPALLDITRTIHHTHPNTKLEGLFARIFEQMPGVVDVSWQGGAGDHGADILVTVDRAHPLTGRADQAICAVQVKSFEGEHGSTGAIEDLDRAFATYPDVSTGLIISTADRATPQFEARLDELREQTGKEIDLLIGEDLALFVMKHANDLLAEL